MIDDAEQQASFERELAGALLSELAVFAPTVGESCLDDLPRHLELREQLKAAAIRREVMLAVLHSTSMLLADAFGPDAASKIIDLMVPGFRESCLEGDTGECSSLAELLKNRFARYERARNDPVASKNPMLKDVMMGIVAACSLGLEDVARMDFATHVGTHVSMWRNAVTDWLEQVSEEEPR